MKKFILSAIAALCASAAMAGPINGSLTITGYEHGTASIGKMTNNPPGPNNTEDVTAAVSALRLDFTDPTDPLGPQSFLAYCIELFTPSANFGAATEYVMNTNPFLGAFSVPFTTRQQDRLSKLFIKNGTLDGSTANATASAAMQLAIWEIVYDDNNFGSLNSGEFYSNSVSGARSAANTLIAGLDSFNTGNFTASFTSFNNGGGKEGFQDFLSGGINAGFGNPDEPGVIPEPGSFALAGLGLLSLGLIRRRKAI